MAHATLIDADSTGAPPFETRAVILMSCRSLVAMKSCVSVSGIFTLQPVPGSGSLLLVSSVVTQFA